MFDSTLVRWLNQFAQQSSAFDHVVLFCSNNDLLKGGVVLACFWAAWFWEGPGQNTARRSLLSALLGAVVAIFLARILAYAAPFRLRPILDSSLQFRPPLGMASETNWTIWSSFPSDHAALFCALCFGIFRTSRRLGLAVAGYILVFILLPRIYIGIHYPTDIAAGIGLGVGVSALLDWPSLRVWWEKPVLWLEERAPAFFYAILFLLSYEIANLFYDVRVVLWFLGFST